MRQKAKRQVMSVVNKMSSADRIVIKTVNPAVTRRNNFMLVLGCFIMLMLAGAGYALYLSSYCTMDHSGWRNHLLQWWPFVTAIGALVVGLRRVKTDTAFAEFGLIGVFAAAMPIGYVLGRLLFF